MKKLKVEITESVEALRSSADKLVSSKFIGSYMSVFRGRGLEFLDYRAYYPDDDASLIDWKATARSNKTMIKVFEEERDINVFFLVDASSSMLLGSTPKLKSEYAAEIVASFSRTVLEAGDSIGFCLFTDRPVKTVLPDKGIKQFHILTETIVNADLYGGRFDLADAFKYLFTTLSPGTLVIIVSDFIISGEDWEHYMEIASKKFQMIGMMIRDPLDSTLPKIKGEVIVSDPFSDNAMLIEPDLIREPFKNEARLEEKRIKNIFIKNDGDFLSLTTNVNFLEPLIGFFKSRETRLK